MMHHVLQVADMSNAGDQKQAEIGGLLQCQSPRISRLRHNDAKAFAWHVLRDLWTEKRHKRN